jgi:DNA-binding XRE family transcriptional regulator
MSLSGEQHKFIAARLLAKTDDEAAKEVGVSATTVYRWKREDEEFLRAYEASFTDGIEVAKNYTRKLLGKMARNYDEMLDATKPIALKVLMQNQDGKVEATGEQEIIKVPDWKTRAVASEAVGKIHGLFVHKTELSGPNGRPIETRQVPAADLSGLTDDELEQLENLLKRAAERAAEKGQ